MHAAAARYRIWEEEMTEILRPGNKVQLSGVYKVIHGREHAAPHYVTVLFGDISPPV